MEDKNIDALRQKIDAALWREMRISAMSQNKKIHQWIAEAISQKLAAEKKHAK